MSTHLQVSFPRVWAIRQISTGRFLPALRHSNDRPSEKEPQENCIPRLFYSRKSATSALTQWLQGVWENRVSRLETYYGIEWESEFEPNPCGNRFASDMEIVEIILSGSIIEVFRLKTRREENDYAHTKSA